MAVIFDLDGTLVDTPQGIVSTFMGVFNDMGRKGIDPADVRATIGMPLEKAFAGLLGEEPTSVLVAECIKTYQTLFKDIVLPHAKSLVFPGVQAGLSELKLMGLPMAIATSKVSKSAHALLDAAGLANYFDVIVCADHVENKKPHPEMGFLVMNKLGIEPETAVMVGDTTHDMLMGNAAGMHTIAVTYGVHDVDTLVESGPKQMVNRFSDVMACIKKLDVYQEKRGGYEHANA